jgi:hypothetical protein
LTDECLKFCPAYFQIIRPLLTGLRAEIATYAVLAEKSEAAYAAYGDEIDRLFPPLDEDVPEVLPVQPRVDHCFGCECQECRR